MKRLYFLSPNIKSTSNIVKELQELGITDAHIHVVGKDHHDLEVAHLHEATLLQTTAVLQACGRGALSGGATGLLAGLVAISFPPAGLVLGGGAILGIGLVGAGFGVWVSSMIGISMPDPVIERFQNAIDQGELLMLVDVPKVRQKEIELAIELHHPEVLIASTELVRQAKAA